MKRNLLILLIIVLPGIRISYAGTCNKYPNTDSLNFKISLSFNNTNAIAVSESIVNEQINNKTVTVSVYTFTIPFFEKAFSSRLNFRNSPKKIISGNYILPSKLPAPCKGSELILFESHLTGKVIGSIENSMELDIHNYTASLGQHDINTKAICGSMIYAQEYFRIIIKQEAQPVLAIKLNIEQKSGSIKPEAEEEKKVINFSLTGSKPGNEKLFLKIIPPCGLTCKKTDYLIDDLIPGNSAFYSCDLNGLYASTLIYKYEKIGGGFYNKEISIPGWTNYSYLNSEKTTSTDTLKKEEAPADDDEIKITPNPVTDILLVKLPGRNKFSISKASVFNISGQLIMMQETNSNRFSINFSGQASGSYIIKIFFEGKNYTEKVIKN